MMSNLRIFKNNHIQDGATLEAESEVTTLGVEFLADEQPSLLWRSDGVTTCYVRGDVGEPVYAKGLWWVNSNFTLEATLKVELFLESGWGTPDFTETFDAWEAVYGFGEGPLGEVGFGGFLADEELPDNPCNVRFFTAGEQYFRYWKITITDTNNTDGYLECGQIGMGEIVEPLRNMQYGYEIGETDFSVKHQADAATFGRKGDRVRQVKFDLKKLTDIEALFEFRQIAKTFGITKKTVLCLEPDSAQGRVIKSVYGSFHKEKLKYKHTHVDRWESAYEFLEAA